MKSKHKHLSLILLAVFLLLLAACGPTATPTEVALTHEDVADQGQAIFQANGCAACHGTNGEGVEDLGPALAGHSREVVFKQVRDPRQVPEGSVQMPAFGTDQISAKDLDLIVEFIESLGPPVGAGPFAGSMTEGAHLWLALISLQGGSVDDAKVHLQELVASTEGETHEQAEEILDLLEAGEEHEAEHELEAMLAETEGSELTKVQLHIVLALDSLEAHNDEDATRHLENAVEIATGEEQSHLQELLEELKAGHAHDVEHELEEMLGEEPHGS